MLNFYDRFLCNEELTSGSYLVLMKPPARVLCLDALEDLRQNYDDARAPASKVLQKWRPALVQPKSDKPSAPPSGETSGSPPSAVAGDIQAQAKSMPVAAAG